jgi:PhnB protein
VLHVEKEDLMAKPAKGIPKGFHTITPSIVVKGADRAIDFYKKAFGGEEVVRMAGPDGKGVMHAEIRVGDSIFFVGDEAPGMTCRSPQSLGGSTGVLHLYVTDVDAAFKRAVGAGAKEVMPVADMFWGDRYGQIEDPFGHRWGLATPKEILTPDEMKQRAQEFFSKRGSS